MMMATLARSPVNPATAAATSRIATSGSENRRQNLGRQADSALVADPIWAETPDPLLGFGTGEARCTALRALEERFLAETPDSYQATMSWAVIARAELGISYACRGPSQAHGDECAIA